MLDWKAEAIRQWNPVSSTGPKWNAVPLVKVYSRRAAHRLFHRLASADVSVHHFEFTHAGLLGLLLGRVAGAMRETFSRWIGWYVMIRARK